ncbi:hypothetical protein [Sphingomonas montana]|uniref:hypothetical protein n=1 Tax=Sphingomonas montana TaxID=1843236 RepID=UPI00096E0495|nr:hypothetical protein [Sphingomonas montana]
MTKLDTGPQLIDSYVLFRTTLGGTQYDVYIDVDALREHAQADHATRQQTLDYASTVIDDLVEAAPRKRLSIEPDTTIVIDDVSELSG